MRTLRALDILDTPAEKRFDRFTRLAQRFSQVPIALVSLVDAQRQWLKSRLGLDAAQTPREIAFCGHAILGNGPLVVPDTTRDPRFHDDPLFTADPSIRFYADYPLAAPNGSKLGTLSILHRVPRDLTDADQQLLTDLCKMVQDERALRKRDGVAVLRARRLQADQRPLAESDRRMYEQNQRRRSKRPRS